RRDQLILEWPAVAPAPWDAAVPSAQPNQLPALAAVATQVRDAALLSRGAEGIGRCSSRSTRCTVLSVDWLRRRPASPRAAGKRARGQSGAQWRRPLRGLASCVGQGAPADRSPRSP